MKKMLRMNNSSFSESVSIAHQTKSEIDPSLGSELSRLLEIIIDLPIGFPINKTISLYHDWISQVDQLNTIWWSPKF